MDRAILAGRVLDPSGASVANAKLELVDVDRGTRTTVRSNQVGFYAFPEIRPGHYRIEVSAAGFKTANLTNLTVYTQDDLQELFVLSPGSPLDSVTLKAAGVNVMTSGVVGTVIEPTFISEIPLNGLSFQQLLQLTPGFVTTNTTFASQGQFAVNGQRTNTNYFVVDGVSANVGIAGGQSPGQSAVGSLPALTAFGSTNGLISIEDVEEFGILTSSYSAEFGHAPGAQVSIVSRSGSNTFHGDLFNYLRNNAFDANDWFSNQANLPRASLRQNDFGGVLGGPIRTSSTFLFVSVEDLQLKQPSSSQDLVPSIALRNLAPAALKPFLEAYPLPNGPDADAGLAQANYSFSNPSSLNAESLRIDHQSGEALKAFMRYVHSSSDIRQRGAESNALSTITNTDFSLQTLTAGINVSLPPNTIHDVRFNWSKDSASSTESMDNFGGAIPLSSRLLFPAGVNQQTGLFQFSPVFGPQNVTLTLGRNVNNLQRQFDLLYNFSNQHGTHIAKAGIDFRTLQPVIDPAAYQQQIIFTNPQAVLSSAPLDAVVGASVPVTDSLKYYSSYVQDSWRPLARTAFELGLRWDYAPALTARGSNGLSPSGVTGFSNLSTLAIVPGTTIYRTSWYNFAPRFGLAYEARRSPRTTCVIRGGGGMFYDLSTGPAGNEASPFDPFSASKFLLSPPFPLSQNNASPPIPGTSPPFSVQAFSSTLKTPYIYQWNLSAEQSLGPSQTLNIAGVGSVGHALLRTENYTGGEAGVPSTFAQLLLTDNAGYSNYNALQVKFQRRAGDDIRMIASYSYAHSLDNVSTDSLFDGIPQRFLNPRQDYGPSDFDIRHSASMAFIYSPKTRGSISRFLKWTISGWSIDSILVARSAPPVDVLVSRDIGFGTNAFRPDLIPDMPLYIEDANLPGGQRINPEALSVPSAPRQGDLPRNFFRGFPLFQQDLALGRDFKANRLFSIRLRVEAFNAFNHPDFAAPSGTLGAVGPLGSFIPQMGFGISPAVAGTGLQAGSFGSGLSPLYQIGNARTLQIVAKVTF